MMFLQARGLATGLLQPMKNSQQEYLLLVNCFLCISGDSPMGFALLLMCCITLIGSHLLDLLVSLREILHLAMLYENLVVLILVG